MEPSNTIFGVVIANFLYSNRMEVKLSGKHDNGIYSLDMDADDFLETLSPANLNDARKFFRKASKIVVIQGVSFHDGIIPNNPIAYPKVPIKVIDATYDEFEEIEVVVVKGKVYYIQNFNSDKTYALLDLKEAFNSKKNVDLNTFKGITPEIRLVYMFHVLERQQEEAEKLKKEQEKPINFVANMMTQSGAKVEFVKKNNLGFEVQWESNGYTINTQLDKNFKVLEAGFCTSHNDSTQSATSIVRVLQDYATKRVSRNDHVNVTRTPRRYG